MPDKVQAGDVVCFHSPQHRGRQLIKRVIAVHHSADTPQLVRVHSHLHREEDDKLLHVLEECATHTAAAKNSASTPHSASTNSASTHDNITINGQGSETVRIDRDHLARWREVPAGA